MADMYYLTAADRDAVRDIIRNYKITPGAVGGRTPPTSEVEHEGPAPEVHLIRVPHTGIPAISYGLQFGTGTGAADDDVPGVSYCRPYALRVLQVPFTTEVETVLSPVGDTDYVRVNNLSVNSVPGDSWALAVRSKSGEWFVVKPPAEGIWIRAVTGSGPVANALCTGSTGSHDPNTGTLTFVPLPRNCYVRAWTGVVVAGSVYFGVPVGQYGDDGVQVYSVVGDSDETGGGLYGTAGTTGQDGLVNRSAQTWYGHKTFRDSLTVDKNENTEDNYARLFSAGTTSQMVLAATHASDPFTITAQASAVVTGAAAYVVNMDIGGPSESAARLGSVVTPTFNETRLAFQGGEAGPAVVNRISPETHSALWVVYNSGGVTTPENPYGFWYGGSAYIETTADLVLKNSDPATNADQSAVQAVATDLRYGAWRGDGTVAGGHVEWGDDDEFDVDNGSGGVYTLKFVAGLFIGRTSAPAPVPGTA
ncbi:MAG: hypothetical protein ACRC7O_04575 [Fimbriiglobus sp.]